MPTWRAIGLKIGFSKAELTTQRAKLYETDLHVAVKTQAFCALSYLAGLFCLYAPHALCQCRLNACNQHQMGKSLCKTNRSNIYPNDNVSLARQAHHHFQAYHGSSKYDRAGYHARRLSEQRSDKSQYKSHNAHICAKWNQLAESTGWLIAHR